MSEPDAIPTTGEPGSSTTNTAEHGSVVGIQASVVHNSTVFITTEAATPDQLYRKGIEFLNSGAAGEARRLIDDAITRGHDTSEARFHYLLALMSRRSNRDLTAEERDQLRGRATPAPGDTGSDWSEALTVVAALVDRDNRLDSDHDQLQSRLDALPRKIQAAIARHLDAVLADVMSEDLWRKIHRTARRDQLAGDRVGRTWAYFEPDPAPPLTLKRFVEPPTPGSWFRTVIALVIFAVTGGEIAATALDDDTISAKIAVLLAVLSYGAAWYAGLIWEFRSGQLAAHAQRFAFSRGLRRPTSPFARRVDERLRYYTIKYAPEKTDLNILLNETTGFRSALRDELADLYKDKYSIPEVGWLIRHLASDLVARWRNGTLHDYRIRYRTPRSVKVLAVASITVTLSAAMATAVIAADVDPLHTAFAGPVAAAAGWAATICSIQLVNDLRSRYEAEREYRKSHAARTRAYLEWRRKVRSHRPSEEEMENWLDADRKVFLGRALTAYRLQWRDLIAHAVLQSRASWYKRAQSQGGPWRYDRYELTIFLITREGVREVRHEVDFKTAEARLEERSNYRFDALSSVQYRTRGDHSSVLTVTLTNGDPREFRIVDAVRDAVDEAGQPDTAVEHPDPDRDSTGFSHALHVLEGMAAEGRKWIDARRAGLRPAKAEPTKADPEEERPEDPASDAA